MEVHLDSDVQAKLSRIAVARAEAMPNYWRREAIERFVDYDEWFIREVEKGIAAAHRGEFLTHEEVGVRLKALLATKRPRS